MRGTTSPFATALHRPVDGTALCRTPEVYLCAGLSAIAAHGTSLLSADAAPGRVWPLRLLHAYAPQADGLIYGLGHLAAVTLPLLSWSVLVMDGMRHSAPSQPYGRHGMACQTYECKALDAPASASSRSGAACRACHRLHDDPTGAGRSDAPATQQRRSISAASARGRAGSGIVDAVRRALTWALALLTLAPLLWLHWKVVSKSAAVMMWPVVLLSPAYGWTVPLWACLMCAAALRWPCERV